MADADHGMTSIEVEVLLAIFIPYVRALSFHDVDVVDGVNVEEVHIGV